MYQTHELYDHEDFGDAGGEDDRHRLRGRHTEAECRRYRDEMARREALYASFGCSTEYRRLTQATRRRLPESERTALAVRKRLPVPKDDGQTDRDSSEKGKT